MEKQEIPLNPMPLIVVVVDVVVVKQMMKLASPVMKLVLIICLTAYQIMIISIVVFPCAEIALDAQGGGIAVMEALHDKDKIGEDEVAIWPTIDDKEKDTDDPQGAA